MEIISKSLADTAAVAGSVLDRLPSPAERSGAAVLALYGDLGSGKTTFTQFLAKALGLDDYVTSPTFVIEKRYKIPPFPEGAAAGRGGLNSLIHLDCYRLASSAEMAVLDWTEIAADPQNLIVIEWPERIEDLLPADAIKIQFEYCGENERRIAVINGK